MLLVDLDLVVDADAALMSRRLTCELSRQLGLVAAQAHRTISLRSKNKKLQIRLRGRVTSTAPSGG